MPFTQTLATFSAKYVIFLLEIVAAVWFVWKVPRPQKQEVVLFAAFSLPLTFIVALIASKLYYDPRPFVAGHFVPLIAHSADNGFPSDHMLLSAAVASVAWRF